MFVVRHACSKPFVVGKQRHSPTSAWPLTAGSVQPAWTAGVSEVVFYKHQHSLFECSKSNSHFLPQTGVALTSSHCCSTEAFPQSYRSCHELANNQPHDVTVVLAQDGAKQDFKTLTLSCFLLNPELHHCLRAGSVGSVSSDVKASLSVTVRLYLRFLFRPL